MCVMRMSLNVLILFLTFLSCCVLVCVQFVSYLVFLTFLWLAFDEINK